jgi:uroporphyrinogen-III decarboxylase
MPMTPKELFLETIKKDGSPDRLPVQWEALGPVMNDPLTKFTRGNRQRGKNTRDRWGTMIYFPENAPGPMPHITDDDKVCPDVTEWEKYVHAPDLMANCSDPALWEDALKLQEEVRAQGLLSMGFMGTGIFEQSHFLMGFEDALANLLEEPEATKELIDYIAEYRFTYAKLIVDNLHPDAILSHDDWGSHDNLFFPPRIWEEFFKEHYRRIYGYMREHDVIVMHHADSYCEPLAPQMAEIGIQVWQGCLCTNDIVKMQDELKGDLTFMGGIDSVIDREDQTEEEVRAETRRACETYGPGGHFIPCNPSGLKASGIYPLTDKFIEEETRQYNKDVYGIYA